MLDPCQETESFSLGTAVHCTYDFHFLGSDELGVRPYSGSYFDLTVRDGRIAKASVYWEIERFSPRSWEPFARWVSRVYPKDAAVTYEDDRHTMARPTQESIQLWEQHTRGYVKHMKA